MRSSLLDKFIRKIISIPAYTVFLLDHKLGRQVRPAHARPPLFDDMENTEVEKIERDLRRDGFSQSTLNDLGLDEEDDVLACSDRIAERLSSEATRLGPSFQHSTLTSSVSDIINNPIVFQFGLSKTFLKIVETYFGGPAAYDGCMVFFSIPDGKENGPRFWHKDREDKSVLKIGVYLTDVYDGCGPLEIAVSDDPYLRRSLKVLSHRFMKTKFPTLKVAQLVGKRGTIVFADTTKHYHRGCPPTERPRSVIYYTYMRSPPAFPFYCSGFRLKPQEIDKLLDTLDLHQSQAARWKTQVRSWKRWIPAPF